MASPPKLVLAVIDGLKPAMLERAIATDRAPALKAIVERGTYVDDCCAAFPSVTAGCVATYLGEHDRCDCLLLSLPDNDTHSHRNGPHAQVTSIANADRQLERMFHAAGGADAFLDEHAVIVVADHSHAPVERRIEL